MALTKSIYTSLFNNINDYQGATWDPDGRMILIAFSESSTLGSIHFASKPPSLGMNYQMHLCIEG